MNNLFGVFLVLVSSYHVYKANDKLEDANKLKGLIILTAILSIFWFFISAGIEAAKTVRYY